MMSIKEKNTANTDNNIFEVNDNFYQKYSQLIRIVVTRILSRLDLSRDIEDCVNIVFLELMERLQQYNEMRGSMAAFVTIITRSAAINYCKKNERKTSELIGDDKINLISEPLEIENELEFEMLVENIIAKLNKKERILFTMYYIEYYSPKEIAESFKIKLTAVYMRINRLNGKLKTLLKKGGINHG
jgi:RNA polymerase sigma-70 factor (ECF subfamily)